MHACGLTASDLWENISASTPSLQSIVFLSKYISTPPPPPPPLSVPCSYSEFDVVSFLVQDLLGPAISQIFVSAFAEAFLWLRCWQPRDNAVTINALCPVGSYSSQSRQTPVQKNAHGAQTLILFKHNFPHEWCESPFFLKCDAHVDFIVSEVTFNVNVQSMRHAAPRFDRDGAQLDHASG